MHRVRNWHLRVKTVGDSVHCLPQRAVPEFRAVHRLSRLRGRQVYQPHRKISLYQLCCRGLHNPPGPERVQPVHHRVLPAGNGGSELHGLSSRSLPVHARGLYLPALRQRVLLDRIKRVHMHPVFAWDISIHGRVHCMQ